MLVSQIFMPLLHEVIVYCGRGVRSYLCARGADPITLLHQRGVKPGLDGLVKQKSSDQTVQVWLTKCQRGKSCVVRPARRKYDLNSHPQYPMLGSAPRFLAGNFHPPFPCWVEIGNHTLESLSMVAVEMALAIATARKLLAIARGKNIYIYIFGHLHAMFCIATEIGNHTLH